MVKSIGFEVELGLYGGSSDYVFDKVPEISEKYEREYYDWMIERNDFYYRGYKLDYKKIVDCVREEIMSDIWKISRGCNYNMPLFSEIMCLYGGVVSNGIHIHFGLDFYDLSVFDAPKYVIFDRLRGLLFRLYNKYIGFGVRTLFSHHIWGYYRDSEYDFKRNQRYRIGLYRREYNTFEMRIFNLEDLLIEYKNMTKVLKGFERNFKRAYNEGDIYRLKVPRAYLKLMKFCSEIRYEDIVVLNDLIRNNKLRIRDCEHFEIDLNSRYLCVEKDVKMLYALEEDIIDDRFVHLDIYL